jgi:hypothetical protein
MFATAVGIIPVLLGVNFDFIIHSESIFSYRYTESLEVGCPIASLVPSEDNCISCPNEPPESRDVNLVS